MAYFGIFFERAFGVFETTQSRGAFFRGNARQLVRIRRVQQISASFAKTTRGVWDTHRPDFPMSVVAVQNIIYICINYKRHSRRGCRGTIATRRVTSRDPVTPGENALKPRHDTKTPWSEFIRGSSRDY